MLEQHLSPPLSPGQGNLENRDAIAIAIAIATITITIATNIIAIKI